MVNMPWFFASFTRFALGSFVRLELHCPGIQHHHLRWQAFLLAKFFLQIFTKETCSMLSSMDLAEKVQRQFCFYFVPWHILIGQVKPRICQTGYIERTWLSRCGVWQLAKHHHSKTSRRPTCMSQVLLSRILEGRGPTLPWCWHFSSFFLKLCEREMRDGSDENVLRGMMQLTDGLLNFTSMQYSHDLWLPRECAEFMYLQGLVALRSYGYLARHCMGLGKRYFGMRPKFHLLAETVFELKSCVTLGHTWILSPVIYNCEVNEDFIGRVSRISRHVSSRTVVLRTLQRYGVALRARLRRLKPRSSKISKAMTCKEKANAKHLVDHHAFCKFALLPFFWNVIFLYPLLPFLPEKTFVSKILRHGVSRKRSQWVEDVEADHDVTDRCDSLAPRTTKWANTEPIVINGVTNPPVKTLGFYEPYKSRVTTTLFITGSWAHFARSKKSQKVCWGNSQVAETNPTFFGNFGEGNYICENKYAQLLRKGIYDSKKSPTGPSEWTRKPEYLIVPALA